jgi:hypothetical protein
VKSVVFSGEGKYVVFVMVHLCGIWLYAADNYFSCLNYNDKFCMRRT